jgi:PAS domain S-box-containing protein
MDSLRTNALPATAEGNLATVVRRFALVLALAVTVTLPGGYFSLKYSGLAGRLQTMARIKAGAITELVVGNPDLWMYEVTRLDELLLKFPVPLENELATVRDAAAKAVVTVGVPPDTPILVRAYPLYDSGRVVGHVEIAHSYRDVLFGTLGAALLGLLLGAMVFATLFNLPLRALRRMTIALINESAALSASASRYRAIAETGNDAIVSADGAGLIVGWNPAAERMFGYAEAEIIGQPLTVLMPYRYRDRHVDGMRRVRTGGERHVIGRTVELHGLTKSGREFPLELALTEWEEPKGTFFAGIIRDITERKQAELVLARQKDLYDVLSQTNKAIVHHIDRDELFTDVCRVAVEHGRFSFAWIGLVDENDPRLRPVARYGEDAGYIDQLNAPENDAVDSGRGLTGRTLLSGNFVISNDFLADPAMAPWHEAAKRAGVRAAAKFPIREGGAVIGAINLYAGDTGFFTKDLIATLEEMAADVSFALDNYVREAARRKAEEELREGEERYRQMFQTNPQPMWVYDIDTLAFLAVNDAAVAHYGWSREQFLAMTIADIRSPEDMPALLEYFSSESGKRLRKNKGVKHRKQDGTLIDVEITSHVIDFEGRHARIVSAVDITEHKRAMEVLRNAEEQFRGLVEQSIAGIYIIQDGKLVYVNPRAAEIVGQGMTDALIGTDPLSWIAEADRGKVAQAVRRLSGGEVPSVVLEFGIHRSDGVAVQVGANAARATHEGRPAIVGLIQDISEKKRAEEQIQRYVAQLKTAFLSTVEVATTLSEMRDPYTAGHERRVGEIAAAIGAELGLDEQRVEGLRVAGHLHDIGKITIPAEILSKPGKLSDIEYRLIQGHPQSGYDVLKDVEFPWPVAQVALQHHERMDGSGYPQGLKDDAIILEARIMAVADVVEAMSSHRPYRPGLGIDKSLAEIERGRGTAYDADVADACLRLFREKGYRLPA